MIGTMTAELIKSTDLVVHAHAAARVAGPHLKTALLAVRAMLERADWKQLLREGELERDWPDMRKTFGELYEELHLIPKAIYGTLQQVGAKPVVRIVSG